MSDFSSIPMQTHFALRTFLATMAASATLITAAAMAEDDFPKVIAPAFKSESFEAQVTLNVGYKYLLSLPEDFGKDPARKWPLVIFLHGAGERGDDLARLQKHGPPKLIAAGKKIPAIVVSPQVPAGSAWNSHGVKALIDKIVATHPVDQDRIYLTGISMGGFGTWDTLFDYPDTFAAAVPICGGAGVKFVMAQRVKNIPIWIFHGAKDPVVEPSFSQRIYTTLNKLGAPVKLTLYPDLQHDSWTVTYDNQEVWDWLFQQKRTPVAK
ncbi:MAG: PHB depolymerase family esterase [Verrucomicrobium sp.]